MPSPERTPLPAHPPRGARASSGCASALFIAFGLPFMAAGVLIALMAQGVITARSAGGPVPSWVLHALSVVFFAPGLFIAGTGVSSVVTSRREKRRRADHPNDPWLADQWDPEGAFERPRQSLLSQVATTAFVSVFLAPFNYFVFVDEARSSQAPFFAKALVGLFDAILVLMLVGILTTIWHRARYGRSRLAFGSFPFFLGQPLRVRLSTGRTLGAFKRLVWTLRCIEERTETTQTAKGRSTRIVCDQLWADEITLAESWALQEGEIPVSFRLPEGDYATRLAEPPVRYWEIEVTADTAGLDFRAVFPLPVYARPGA